MSESERKLVEERELEEQPRRRYEHPEIRWREPYDPVSFGVSCAKQPGNPPCIGFYSS